LKSLLSKKIAEREDEPATPQSFDVIDTLMEQYGASQYLRMSEDMTRQLSSVIHVIDKLEMKYPAKFLSDIYGVTRHHYDKARLWGQTAFPGGSPIELSKVPIHRKKTPDSLLECIAGVLIRPENSHSAEANKTNNRKKVLLERSTTTEQLYDVYCDEGGSKISRDLFYRLISTPQFPLQTAENAACSHCANHCYGAVEDLRGLLDELRLNSITYIQTSMHTYKHTYMPAYTHTNTHIYI
jgi:hypothetical protein